MEEAAELADRVGIIDRGRLVVEGTPAQLISEMGADVMRISGHGKLEEFTEQVRRLAYVDGVHESSEVLQIGVDNGNRRLPEIVSMATANDYAIEDISVAKPSLGDVFLKYTGRELRDT
jgi:ABC-2 type transport system ATP-binding protein